jgi:hypothetical protein
MDKVQRLNNSGHVAEHMERFLHWVVYRMYELLSKNLFKLYTPGRHEFFSELTDGVEIS